jgi:hypothetical protein
VNSVVEIVEYPRFTFETRRFDKAQIALWGGMTWPYLLPNNASMYSHILARLGSPMNGIANIDDGHV